MSEDQKQGQLAGLKHAVYLIQTRRHLLNKSPGYAAALDELEIFLLAAIERVESGEPMADICVVSASVNCRYCDAEISYTDQPPIECHYCGCNQPIKESL